MKQLIDNFLNYLTVEKGFSKNTILAYRNDLNQLADFAEEEVTKQGITPSWDKLSRQEMLSYLLSLTERGYVPTTKARKVAAAKSAAVGNTAVRCGRGGRISSARNGLSYSFQTPPG